MNNTITAPRKYGNLSDIDTILPFDGKDVCIWNLEWIPKGRGHYSLLLQLEVDDTPCTLMASTTDSKMYDDRIDDDGELDIHTLHDAIEYVIKNCQHELETLEL
jgi:hypothetical protein